MFDTGKIKFRMTAKVRNRLKEADAQKLRDIVIYQEKFFYIKPAIGGKSVKIHFDINKKFFRFECSIPKLLQGHNICGSNNIEKLCLEAIKLIYQKLGLKFDRNEEALIRRRRIELYRVDLACSFMFESLYEAQQVNTAIAHHIIGSGEGWSVEGKEGVETTYLRKHSRRVTDKFYLKGKEVMVNKLPAELREHDRIFSLAQRLLRFEVTYRRIELKRIGKELGLDLCYADQWSVDVIERLLRGRIESFGFNHTIMTRLEPKILPDLSKPAQAFYLLYAQGVDMRQTRSYAPLKRARKEILEHGVDIFHPLRDEVPLNLADLLSTSRIKLGSPKSLIRLGAVMSFGA